MTMSDTEVQASTPGEESRRTATENGFSDGQEVNKAKDPADGGGSLFQKADDNCVDDKSDAQPVEQSPSKSKLRRGISFPKESFVSGYCEPPDPWKEAPRWTAQDILSAYRRSCEKHGAKPLNKVVQQIEGFSCNGKREEKLVLKGDKIDTKQCETFEEILRRVQFKSIDLESCHLDDESAVAWFDMIEYYESTCHLNISFNKNIGVRGWQACSRLIRRTPCLTTLDLRNCDMNDRSIPIFGRALKLGSHLTVLHMENMYLSGRSLIILVAALKMNDILQELFLADNRLMPSDGIQLGNLLKYNHSLTLLDLRNNHLQDVGVGHVCDGLYEQNLDKGLRTLVLWNNQITYQAMAALSRALGSTKCLETLNLGHNNVTNEGIHILKEGLLKSKSLMRLGLQSTRLTCEGAVALAEYVADSFHLLRLDLRENDIKTAGLMALSLALKVNESVTRMDVDKETKKESGMKDYAEQQRRLQQEMKGYLERNQQRVLQREEEERRQLEERAQVEMAARASVQSVITSAQQAIQAHPEMMYVPAPAPEPESKPRPSLLFNSHRLTPQESLESPHCADVHFLPVKGGEAGGVVPDVSVSVSSPPLSLELPNPLTSQPIATSVASSGDNGGMALPLTNPLTTALRSPPMELLLSPQYYPKPTARKIFSVSRVMETSPASPTVSKTGVLDTGATGVSNTPAMKLAASRGGSRAGSGGGAGAPAPISPTLLCQDLSMKTVNDYIQQIVSDSPLPADGCEQTQTATDRMSELHLMDDPMEGQQEEDREREMQRNQDGGDVLLKGQGDFPLKEEESYGDLDPLGVLQAPVSSLPGEAASGAGCDSVKGNSGDSSQIGGPDLNGPARENVTVQSECDAASGGVGEISTDEQASGGKVCDLVNAVTGADIQTIPVLSDVVPSSGDLSSTSSGVPRQDPSAPEAEVTAQHLPAQTVLTDEDGEAVEESAERALMGEPEAESTQTSTAEQVRSQNHAPRPASPQGPEESPLFKTMEFPDFGIDEEDLSLFGASSSSSEAASSSSPVAKQGAECDKESTQREGSPGLSEAWLSVDVPGLGDQPKGERAEGGEKQPDFFTALSLNGLTQELASALSSIDESGASVDNQAFGTAELHTPDEFERELDAMIASVKNELPWPLQKDPAAAISTDEQQENEDNCGSQSTA